MRPVLYSEIAKERCNAKAFGAFNSAVRVSPSNTSEGDLVYNTQTKTVGIVRAIYGKESQVRTDSDGVVSANKLQKYNKNKSYQQKAKIAPSTKREANL